VTYFLGILIFMMPIAVLVGFGSKQAAMRSPRGWTWLKIACQAVLLSACLTGFIVALDVFEWPGHARAYSAIFANHGDGCLDMRRRDGWKSCWHASALLTKNDNRPS
jgi:hypothetical protein